MTNEEAFATIQKKVADNNRIWPEHTSLTQIEMLACIAEHAGEVARMVASPHLTTRRADSYQESLLNLATLCVLALNHKE